jgi:hypothetical protein
MIALPRELVDVIAALVKDKPATDRHVAQQPVAREC